MFSPRILLILALLAPAAVTAELRPLPTSSPEAWAARRKAIIEAAQQIMGPLPGAEKRCPLEVKVESESDEGTYVRRFITYASEPGDRTTAWLLIPKPALAGAP